MYEESYERIIRTEFDGEHPSIHLEATRILGILISGWNLNARQRKEFVALSRENCPSQDLILGHASTSPQLPRGRSGILVLGISSCENCTIVLT